MDPTQEPIFPPELLVGDVTGEDLAKSWDAVVESLGSCFTFMLSGNFVSPLCCGFQLKYSFLFFSCLFAFTERQKKREGRKEGAGRGGKRDRERTFFCSFGFIPQMLAKAKVRLG